VSLFVIEQVHVRVVRGPERKTGDCYIQKYTYLSIIVFSPEKSWRQPQQAGRADGGPRLRLFARRILLELIPLDGWVG
jgi:hypothetical protein